MDTESKGMIVLMAKIGILTLYKDNFGSILQTYSTYSYLNDLGFECEILKINYSTSLIDKIIRISKQMYMILRYRNYLSDKLKQREANKKDIKLLSNKTKKLMDAFIKSNLKVIELDSRTGFDDINDKYDFFITGSDQVWNGFDEYYFLVFADRDKRIAFAPSFGASLKEYYKKKVKRALSGFDVLSTREEFGVKIIKELTGREAFRLADPTILYGRDKWRGFAAKGIQKCNYILVHFLNKPNEMALRSIEEYIQLHDCSVYCICNRYEEYDQLSRFEFLDISPYDYVALINGADYVFTDSFHSTLFSLNLETPFLTFERQYLHGNSQSSRIEDLLGRVGMKDCYICEKEKPLIAERMEWNSDSMFEEERKALKEYLGKALRIHL